MVWCEECGDYRTFRAYPECHEVKQPIRSMAAIPGDNTYEYVLCTEAVKIQEVQDLIERLRKRANDFMPLFAEESSKEWYVYGGGRERRKDSHLLREAATMLARLL